MISPEFATSDPDWECRQGVSFISLFLLDIELSQAEQEMLEAFKSLLGPASPSTAWRQGGLRPDQGAGKNIH